MCCFSFNVDVNRTAHIFTHYLKISLEEFQQNIEIFCKSNVNVKWIAKVGADVLDRMNIDVDTYIAQLLSGHYPFDELAILIASISHNIHTIVLINRSYWTTRRDLEYSDCLVKLAFCGDRVFKEITQTDLPTNLHRKVHVDLLDVDVKYTEVSEDSGIDEDCSKETANDKLSEDDVTIEQIEITPIEGATNGDNQIGHRAITPVEGDTNGDNQIGHRAITPVEGDTNVDNQSDHN